MPIKGEKPVPAKPQSSDVPIGPPPYVFEDFEGISTSTTRPGVDQKKMWWCDGFMPIGKRKLQTMYGLSEAIYAAPELINIVVFKAVNIGPTPYLIIALTDGSILAVNLGNNVATTLAGPGTIQSPSPLNIGISQWGSQYVLIVARQTDGYFIWDGTTFFLPGASFGGGNTPTGLGGHAIETYAGRVWIANGSTILFSAPGSLIEFSSGAGGGNFSSADSFLRVTFTALRQSNGFLYLIADSSMNYISGVQTSGSPPVTTFTNQNADPEIGTPWPWSVETYGRNIVFANAFGAHVSYGAAITKVSEDLDGVYNTLPGFGGLLASSAKATLNGKKVWMILLNIVDPYTGQPSNKLFLWNSKFWWSSPQDARLTFVGSQEVDSVLTAWGTDSYGIYKLFARPTTAFSKVVRSRLWDTPVGIQEMKAAVRLWGMAQYYAQDGEEITINIDNETGTVSQTIEDGPLPVTWYNNAGQVVTWYNNSAASVAWVVSGVGIVVFEPDAVGQNGTLLGMTASTNASDLALIQLMLQPQSVGYRG